VKGIRKQEKRRKGGKYTSEAVVPLNTKNPYRKENTALHHYKDQPVNGCLRK
jgi:hypothetical protein